MVNQFKSPEEIVYTVNVGNEALKSFDGDGLKNVDVSAKDKTGKSAGYLGILYDIVTSDNPGSVIDQYKEFVRRVQEEKSLETYVVKNQPLQRSALGEVTGLNLEAKPIAVVDNSGTKVGDDIKLTYEEYKESKGKENPYAEEMLSKVKGLGHKTKSTEPEIVV